MLESIAALAGIPTLRHVITTREGGVSRGPYASLNLGYHVDDDPACVTENRRRVAVSAGYDAAALVTARQVHGTALAWAAAAERGRGAFSPDDALAETDGLLTTERRLPLAILVADCAPVLLVDPRRQVLALVHAGWRGALGGIASAAVRQMIDRTGADPQTLQVGIGPALCAACLEVSAEIAADVEAKLGADTVIRTGFAKPHLDLQAMLRADLARVGITSAQIAIHPHCTRCRNERYFSYRAQGGVSGRIAVIAWWK